MTELQQAVANATEAAETAAARRWGTQLVAAEVRAAAAHLTPEQQAALVEVVDPTKFLTAEGEVDTAAIGQWVERAYPKPAEGDPRPPGFPDVAQGARGAPIAPPQPSGIAALIAQKIGAGG